MVMSAPVGEAQNAFEVVAVTAGEFGGVEILDEQHGGVSGRSPDAFHIFEHA